MCYGVNVCRCCWNTCLTNVDPIQVDEFPRILKFGQFVVQLWLEPRVARGIWRCVPNYKQNELSTALQQLLEAGNDKLILQIEHQMYAIFQKGGFIYIFDPFRHRVQGDLDPENLDEKTASLRMFRSMDLFLNVLNQMLGEYTKTNKFYIHALHIRRIELNERAINKPLTEAEQEDGYDVQSLNDYICFEEDEIRCYIELGEISDFGDDDQDVPPEEPEPKSESDIGEEMEEEGEGGALGEVGEIETSSSDEEGKHAASKRAGTNAGRNRNKRGSAADRKGKERTASKSGEPDATEGGKTRNADMRDKNKAKDGTARKDLDTASITSQEQHKAVGSGGGARAAKKKAKTAGKLMNDDKESPSKLDSKRPSRDMDKAKPETKTKTKKSDAEVPSKDDANAAKDKDKLPKDPKAKVGKEDSDNQKVDKDADKAKTDKQKPAKDGDKANAGKEEVGKEAEKQKVAKEKTDKEKQDKEDVADKTKVAQEKEQPKTSKDDANKQKTGKEDTAEQKPSKEVADKEKSEKDAAADKQKTDVDKAQKGDKAVKNKRRASKDAVADKQKTNTDDAEKKKAADKQKPQDDATTKVRSSKETGQTDGKATADKAKTGKEEPARPQTSKEAAEKPKLAKDQATKEPANDEVMLTKLDLYSPKDNASNTGIDAERVPSTKKSIDKVRKKSNEINLKGNDAKTDKAIRSQLDADKKEIKTTNLYAKETIEDVTVKKTEKATVNIKIDEGEKGASLDRFGSLNLDNDSERAADMDVDKYAEYGGIEGLLDDTDMDVGESEQPPSPPMILEPEKTKPRRRRKKTKGLKSKTAAHAGKVPCVLKSGKFVIDGWCKERNRRFGNLQADEVCRSVLAEAECKERERKEAERLKETACDKGYESDEIKAHPYLVCNEGNYPGFNERPTDMAVVGSKSGSYESIMKLLLAGFQCTDRVLLVTRQDKYVIFRVHDSHHTGYYIYDGCVCSMNRFRHFDLRTGTNGLIYTPSLHDAVCCIGYLRAKLRPKKKDKSDEMNPVDKIVAEYVK